MAYAKWIGGAVGWALGGPIGGVMGYWLGKMFSDDSLAMDGGMPGGAGYAGGGRAHARTRTRPTQAGDFALSMVVLSAAVMQADNRVLKSELDYVKSFFKTNFGQAQAEQLTLALREALKNQVDVRGSACRSGPTCPTPSDCSVAIPLRDCPGRRQRGPAGSGSHSSHGVGLGHQRQGPCVD